MSTLCSNDVLTPRQLAFIAERLPEPPSTPIYPRLIAMRSVIDLPDALTGSLAGTLAAFWHLHHPGLPLCSSLAQKRYKMGRESRITLGGNQPIVKRIASTMRLRVVSPPGAVVALPARSVECRPSMSR
jgi:hypothetical protein